MPDQPQQQSVDAAGAAEPSALLEQLALAVAEERSRLARELHDTVAQSLAALVQKLDQVGEPRAEIVEARALAHQVLEEMRRAIWGLRPALLEALPLHEALAREVEQMADEAGLSSRVTLVGQPRPLLPQQEMALFRIAQEALSNTIRHAAARRVRVTLAYAEQEVQLFVEDDGRGFEPAALESARFSASASAWLPYFEQPGGTAGAGPAGHFGLQSMRERAYLVGGWLKLESAPGQGTRVLVTLPYAPLANAVGAAVLPSMKETTQMTPAPSVAGLLPAARQISAAQPGQTTVPAGRIRVLIVDDHAMTRAGIRHLLENYPDVEVVGEAADGLEALAEAQDLGPQVILMDRRMAGMDGLEALRQLRASNRDVRVLMLSAFAQDDDVLESLKAGASGFVLKDVTPDELASVVRAVARGETLLSPGLTGKLIDRFGHGASAEQQAAMLTGREQEVLRLLAGGLRNKEMARQLQVSERTVTFHLANIYQKLGVTSRTEALSRALELGLLNAATPLVSPR
jgi:DNA-binding NarL/FixJ family response regulator/two-component sensor histidine kinase